MTVLMVVSFVAAVSARRMNTCLEKSLVDSFYNQLYVASKANEQGRHDQAICWCLRAYQTAPASGHELTTSARHLIGAGGQSSAPSFCTIAL